ncbi:hypothetical protein [Methylobacterium sp. J-076]|uniref:hypothetical protein n=1 Tax=Methylobacterium sp. J-076 TaxID=2836655 RepID=UPI001FB9CA0A|nr:hypothetical protein [Methylobacterium sp. J-076]MCJ2014764.1 hypothetical protein [Methylobacterium sp. J-076]
MRYRTFVIAAALAGLSAGPGRTQDQETLAQKAQAQEEQALALLRASSAQSAIITFCAKHFTIDGTTALRISQTARDVASKILGEDRSTAAFKDELARRYAEVKDIGEQQWCADQRDALAQGEAQIFKN